MNFRPTLGNRRGATLVVVATMMVVFVGMVGVGVDFARMYAFKAQLQTVADAAAMSGAVEIVYGRKATAQAAAIMYAGKNHVEGNNSATVTNADVIPGKWDFDAKTFTPTPSFTDATTTAIKVKASYPAIYTFGTVFGITSTTLRDSAVAALGYAGSTSCLKPWAINYKAMLDNIYPPGTKDPTSYDLTSADVTTLAGNQAEVTLLMDNTDPIAGGNIAQVVVADPWNGNATYKDAISGPCPNLQIIPGVTWLDANPGQGAGQSSASVADLCGVNGNPANFACNVKAKMAIWDTHTGAPGANLKFHVKYVGVFTITSYSKGTGPGSPPDQIRGHFTSMVDPQAGGFSGTPSPILGYGALVQ